MSETSTSVASVPPESEQVGLLVDYLLERKKSNILAHSSIDILVLVLSSVKSLFISG